VAPAPAARAVVRGQEVIVSISPLNIPALTHYHDHAEPDDSVGISWPASGWLQGYRIELEDAAGNVLSRDMLHHAGVVNPARRQLGYDAPERLLAVGKETSAVELPTWMGLALSEGQRLVAYYALVNPTEHAVEGATLRITARWRPLGSTETTAARRPHARPYHPMQRGNRISTHVTEVRPFAVGAGPDVGGSGPFDVPAGHSVHSAEFTLSVAGRLRAVGGHLHDYASEVRLEDAATGRVLVRLRARTDEGGRLQSVEQNFFLFRPGGLRLEAERRYRLVAVYDNPTRELIPLGAMAYMAGPFIPDP
jgi:hypothetical protein